MAIVEKKNSLLTGRNLSQNWTQGVQPFASPLWVERREIGERGERGRGGEIGGREERKTKN